MEGSKRGTRFKSSPDLLLRRYARKRVQLMLRLLKNRDDGVKDDMILIEGDRTSLRMLGDLIKAFQ
jgi:hypothetical protein